MRWRLALAGTAIAGLVAGGVAVTTANAGTSLCDTYAQTRTVSGYVAQNNRWGADTAQCLSVSGDGFTLTTSDANKPTNGAPAAYPSIFWGCHYGTCTTAFAPIRTSSSEFAQVSTSVQYGYVDQGAYDAAYDIWFDPTARTDGQNTGAEVMLWLDHRGSVQPIGAKVGTAHLAGADWDVWFGTIGWNVVSYVRSTPATSLSTPVSAFYDDAVRRGYAQTSWYLTSVQAGFEPWVGGTGLAVRSFAVTTQGLSGSDAPATSSATGAPRASSATASSAPSSTAASASSSPAAPGTAGARAPTSTTAPARTSLPPTETRAPGGASAACTISTRRDEWPGGFVRYVTLTNTGSAPVTTWTLSLQVGEGQQLTSGWSAAWGQVGRQVTAGNLDWNATLAPGASVSMGFQGTWSGSDPEPTQWALDGTPCATV